MEYVTEAAERPASERCPHPEWWHSVDQEASEVEVSELVGAFVRALQPQYVVETGSCYGQTTERIVRALQVNGHGHLFTLEVDPGRVEMTRERVGVSPEWTILCQSSMDWNPLVALPIGLVFSDSYGPVRIPEVQRMIPFMSAGATVIFHDTAPEPAFPFRQMLQEELVEPGIFALVDLPTPRGVSIGQLL
jgi:predicted O-methyltransferase YrrM